MDPMSFLFETNGLRRATMHAVAREALKNQEKMDHNLAAKIVNGVANLWSK